jgi:hypothetical protein
MNELPKHDTTKSPISSEYGTTAHRGYGQAHRPAVDAGPEAQRAGRVDGAGRYSFGNRIASAGSAVNIHRALWPQSEITKTLCFAPYF